MSSVPPPIRADVTADAPDVTDALKDVLVLVGRLRRSVAALSLEIDRLEARRQHLADSADA
jgi:uncharacterized small protein (DUF1192 family)